MNSAVRTTCPGVDAAVTAAARVARHYGRTTTAQRGAILRDLAERLDRASPDLVPIAAAETRLSTSRLTGELARTSFQLRSFADLLDDGAYQEVIIEPPDPDFALGPRPDLRRMLIPLGPVAVYAASNFPFAFSVLGGDTAAALAAGCPVIVKAHPGHPHLSEAVSELACTVLADHGFDDGVLALVEGFDAGIELIQHPGVCAGAFTGSSAGGRALFDLANQRAVPIPFYGELGSINPVFVTRAAIAARGPAIAEQYVASIKLGAGQFCTKPGVLFLPTGHNLQNTLVRAVRDAGPAPMLTDELADRFNAGVAELSSVDGMQVMVRGGGNGANMAPTMLACSAETLRRHPTATLEEHFGPASVVVEYDSEEDLPELASLIPGNLTATVHAEAADEPNLDELLHVLAATSGRLIWNGWPTGVAVSPAMHHGGPYPATTASLHTSVGTTSIRRFLRPICYQSMPNSFLPPLMRSTP